MTVCPSVRVEQLGSYWMDFHEIWQLYVFQKSVEKYQVLLKSDHYDGYSTWRPMCVFNHISPSYFKTRNTADKSCWENQNTHFMFNNFFPKIASFYKTKWKHTVEPDGPQTTIWHMHIACSKPKATDTHSDHVIIIAFPLQQWLYERSSVWLSTYIGCLFRSVQDT